MSRQLPVPHAKTAIDDHHQIITALAKRDARNASAGIAADLGHTSAALIEALSTHPVADVQQSDRNEMRANDVYANSDNNPRPNVQRRGTSKTRKRP